MGFVVKNDEFCIQMMKFVFKMLNFAGKTDGYTRAEGMSQNIIVRTIGQRWRALPTLNGTVGF